MRPTSPNIQQPRIMNWTTLHYIYDPLCGWCYGAAPLVAVAREILSVRIHAGGMMAGTHRQAVTPQLREFILKHDTRIGQLTGQPFGDAYRDGLLCDTRVFFDSEPPIAAMLAAEQLADRGLDMIGQLQQAHYVEGLPIAHRTVLLDAAESIGLDPAAFAQALDRQSATVVQRHIRDTRQFMAQVGANGFPTFVLETEGSMQFVDMALYLGRPQKFRSWLLANTVAPSMTARAAAAGCNDHSCTL